MAVREVLLLGNPRLFQVSTQIGEDELEEVSRVVVDLHDTLMDFRNQHSVGRAIAAPQIGYPKRLIYVCIDEPLVLINPSLEDLSRETMLVWDDCMCFPELLVRVRRHRSCRLQYRDRHWQQCRMALQDDLAELLQHECDHLRGVLAVSMAVDGHSFALKSQKHLLDL